MGRINVGRVVGGGLLAGLVLNVQDFLVHGVMLKAGIKLLNVPPIRSCVPLERVNLLVVHGGLRSHFCNVSEPPECSCRRSRSPRCLPEELTIEIRTSQLYHFQSPLRCIIISSAKAYPPHHSHFNDFLMTLRRLIGL